jgi:hypothetical protein
MRTTIIIGLVLLLICYAGSAQAAQVWIDPVHSEIPEGANFTVSIMVDPEGTEVMGAQYNLNFDNTLLSAVGQTRGTFLSQDGTTTMAIANIINNTLGRVEYGEFRMNTDHGVTDPGVLASVTFQVIGKDGVCELVPDNIVLSDPDALQIPDVDVGTGSVEIVSGICGDVTGDGVVNTGDVILLANYVGYYPGNLNYALDDGQKRAGDVTGNGVIDTGDVILLANYVGYPGYELNCS